MARRGPGLTRRGLLAGLALGLAGRPAAAFGQEGVFHPRLLVVGGRRPGGPRAAGTARWAWELVRRTSAPARLTPGVVAADEPALLAEPFAVWTGDRDPGALAGPEIRGLRRFFDLGGLLVVDDAEPEPGEFGRGARRELGRVLPEAPLTKLPARSAGGADHVVFRTFYLVDRPVGRLVGGKSVDALVPGRDAQVIFLDTDLLGALARTPDGTPVAALPDDQRELAARFAVNLAMYLLCSNYKDDQVHAQALLRRRARGRP